MHQTELEHLLIDRLQLLAAKTLLSTDASAILQFEMTYHILSTQPLDKHTINTLDSSTIL